MDGQHGAQRVVDVMTMGVITATLDDSVEDVARMMRAGDVGVVGVVDDQQQLVGLLTDRDVVVRVVAEALDPGQARVEDVCSRRGVATVTPDSSIEEALRIMRDKAVRRVPVVEEGRLVGMVSLGDLARSRDPGSVLADVSAAPPNA